MILAITKKEFEEKHPEVDTYGLDNYMPVYLENGAILIDSEWNGEFYTVKVDGKEQRFAPANHPDPKCEDDFITVGYEEL